MKTKIFFLMALLLSSTLFGSVVPTYQITAINSRLITLENNSVFEVSQLSIPIIFDWQSGDTIQLVENRDPFRPRKVVIIDGRLVVCPAFYLRNITRNNEQAAALLNVAPSISDASTPTVTAIDTVNRIITLSNATSWTYPTTDQSGVVFWQIGQLIMIGHSALPLSTYDAILFDGAEQSSISASQL